VINATSDSNGEFFGVIWSNPEEGYYDIVVDANGDGYYNISTSKQEMKRMQLVLTIS